MQLDDCIIEDIDKITVQQIEPVLDEKQISSTENIIIPVCINRSGQYIRYFILSYYFTNYYYIFV